MNLHRKAICILFFLVLFSPFYLSSFSEDEPSLEEYATIAETLPEEDLEEEDFFHGEILDDEYFTYHDHVYEDDDYDYDDLFDDFFEEGPHLIIEAPVFETRSLDVVFPNMTRDLRSLVLSDEGFRYSFSANERPILVPNPNLGIDLLGSVMEKNPSHIIEALLVMPFDDRELDLLDIYNALGRIESIKDYTAAFDDREIQIFTESTRIESSSNRREIPDPLPSLTLPFYETIYLRLREQTFGNLFLRGDIHVSVYGLTYSMTNFADVRYFFFPIVRAERFASIIYLEPVDEGMLIYSVSGFYLPGFIADRVNLTPNINRRIEIFIKWITDGLKLQ